MLPLAITLPAKSNGIISEWYVEIERINLKIIPVVNIIDIRVKIKSSLVNITICFVISSVFQELTKGNIRKAAKLYTSISI